MLSTLSVGLVTYLVASLLGYVIHWAIHRRWAGKAYRAHLSHHVEHYPPKDLVSETYRSAGHKSTVYTFVLASVPLSAIPVGAWALGWLGPFDTVAVVLVTTAVGLASDVIHDSFHVHRHWLHRLLPGFDRMRRLHFVHHAGVRRNYGIFSFIWDRAFGTLKQ